MTKRERRPDNRWLYATPLKPEEVVEVRAHAVEMFVEETGAAPSGYSCDECGQVAECSLAFDPWNVGGSDCLLEK